jgi:formamidopyrimidine-DNA glycosylase
LAKNITKEEVKKLFKQIVAVLKLSIKHKGTSSRNYRRSNGEKGNFVNYLKVYGRTGQKCKDCTGLVKKIKHAGRGTHFCENCQK